MESSAPMLTTLLIFVALVIYIFLGYPALIWAVSHFSGRPVKKGRYEPFITFVISAYNEAEGIETKLANTFALEYPQEKLEIIVADDGSSDGTDAIVRRYANRVRHLRIEGRQGKVICQNRAAAVATGEIVVFSDANSIYDLQALQLLLRNLADETVGVVCGELRYMRNDKSDEGLYWRIERFLKRAESELGSCLGANGAIYAVRRHLYTDLPAGACSDFVEPFFAYETGYRVVYEPDAFCTEEPEDNVVEFARKRRIVLNSLQSLSLIRPFLNPFRYGWYSLALWSHKMLRWYAFVFLALTFIYSVLLATIPAVLAFLMLQILFYLFAFAGRYSPRWKLFSIPYYFMVVNAASFLAFVDFFTGKQVTAWEKVR